MTGDAEAAGSVSPVIPAVPVSTYRLQFHGGFTLEDAERLVPYLHDLGVTHVYCSPYLKARAGSAHGYDITDHNALNPELGDKRSFQTFVEALRRHGMGQILDFVPNHVGIGGTENTWWLDVLEYGRQSPFAEFFDIDWASAKAALFGKVMLPFLGDHYGRVLERGELRLRFDRTSGSFSVWYHEHRFPIAPRHYVRILSWRLGYLEQQLAANDPNLAKLHGLIQAFRELPPPSAPTRRRATLREQAAAAKRELAALVENQPAVASYIEEILRSMNGAPGEPRSFEPLHRLLEAQHYRLAYWRVAADEINYRRFFDINDLAGLRMEREDLFELTHKQILEWIEEDRLQGLRIDHIDGLYDPSAYCRRIRKRFENRELYLVVEKILAPHERLRPEWPVDGTTGYEFLNLVNGLFVDPRGKGPLERSYRELIGQDLSYEDMLYNCKKHVMNFLLGSELQVLANELHRIAEADWRTRDFTSISVREALKEIIACFPVYRTYVRADGASPDDRRDIESAVRSARQRSSDPEAALFEWIEQALTGDLLGARRSRYHRRDVMRFVMKFQQYTGPVMAKALEDTCCYRYHRLVSVNEVGGDPRRFGVSPEEFHEASRERSAHWPRAMLTTATHDTKRGEDARARIDVLSEIPEEWAQRVRRWFSANRRFKQEIDGQRAPDRNDEYLLYQTLIGTWPPGEGPPGRDESSGYRERIEAYMVKAVREGKKTSSWRHPNTAYEQALGRFVAKILDASGPNAFLEDFLPFEARVAALGALNSLSQLVLKLTSPGVPDTYRGCELWDLSLVDPDNRRPVDYEHRKRLLAGLRGRFGASADCAIGELPLLVERWWDGRLKLLITWKLLQFRRSHSELFLEGSYLPLSVHGERAEHVCAFARQLGRSTALVAASRLCAGLPRNESPFPLGRRAWEDTFILCPPGCEAGSYRDVVTGRTIEARRGRGSMNLEAAELFADLPVATLAPASGDSEEL